MDFRLSTALVVTFAATLVGCQKAAPPAPANAAMPANAAAAAPAAVPAAATPDAAAAKAFLEGLYANYKTSENNTFQMFDKDAKAVFDDDMIALLAADQKALKGDLGEIDGDWLCDCQDFASLKATIKVQSATPTTATATSDFVDVGIPGDAGHHEQFQLVKTSVGWRIHDIKTSDEPWLRQMLTNEIKQLKSGHKPDSSSD